MGHQKYTDEQVNNILREGEARGKIGELCRKYGVSGATYHRWKAKYAGLTLSELKRLKQIVADQALDNRVLKELLSKNFSRCSAIISRQKTHIHPKPS